MSSHFCLSCCFPVYRVNSNRGREVYVCLTEDCRNFKVSVPESETFVDFWHEMTRQPDYPVEPLEDERPAVTESQLGVARPNTEQPTHGKSDYPDYLPDGESPFSLAENQASASQPCPQQSRQEEPEAVPQSTATSVAKDADSRKTRRKKNVPAQRKDSILEKPWSELPTEEGSDPIAEITKYVNRSVERRRFEAEFNGKARRAVNQFILYRKAYSDIAKVVGMQSFPAKAAESWARESACVHDQFSALANTEKRLHKEAFPNYKYKPRLMNKKKEKKE